jgi:DNA-binding MarR family transcriptional regulator
MATLTDLDPDLVREVESSCICLRVQRASRAVGRRFDKAFRGLDLNNWQFTLLTSLAIIDQSSVNTLARELAMDRTTMTRNLRVLERRGLLAINPDVRDGRVKRVSLTAPGRTLLAQAIERWREVNLAVRDDVPPATLPAMWQALEAIGRS